MADSLALDALVLTTRLREAGISADFDPEQRSFKAQLRAARRSDVEVFVVTKRPAARVTADPSPSMSQLPNREIGLLPEGAEFR